MSKLELDYGQVLLDGSYISEEQLVAGKKVATERNVPLVDYLLAEGIVSKGLLGQAVAEYYDVGYFDIESHTPAPEVVSSLPSLVAQKYQAIVYQIDESQVLIATADPANETLQSLAQDTFADRNIAFSFSFAEDIMEALNTFRGDVREKISQLIAAPDVSTSQIVTELFKEAVAQKASDIHFDPRRNNVVVRFRIDGVMHNVAEVPVSTYSSINNRIKILADLRIDKHMTAQDGALQFTEDNDQVTDMRVSILPTLSGEKIVIRIFDAGAHHLSLSDLGYSLENESKLIRAAKKPFGMILVTGPTGSGKTTVLYTLLRKFNTTDVNVMTIEDPVEYRVDGINQVQVSSETGLTFAHGLRSLLRQDPDVMLVGEIRDHETADIAVNAALTGHLLFSTFHSNDAATAFPRLTDMDVEPFLLASTIEVVIGQRLVRKLCESCRYSYSLPRHEISDQIPNPERYFEDETVTLYAAKGCTACSGLQYRGRIAIVELIENTPELSACLTKNPTDQEIWKIARQHGSETLFEDGLRKVKNGVTTLEELLRVAQPPTTSVSLNMLQAIHQFREPTFRERLYTLGLKKDIYAFIEGLSIMLSSGVSFQEAVQAMQVEATSRRMRALIGRIYQAVDQGESIAVALNETGIVSQHMYALIRSGESAGRLSANLQLLVLQNEKDELFRSKVRSSLLYGLIVLSAALIVGIGVAWYILPQIAGFFDNYNAELPFLTKVLISAGLFTKAYGWFVFPVAGVILFILLYFLFSFPKTRFLGHSVLFHTPVIKELIRNAEIARFGFLFGTMLKAGIPITASLESLQSATTFKNYASCYKHMQAEIESGSSLLASVRSYPQTKNLFKGPALSLLSAAEKSGNLSETLLKIGSIYEKKTEALSRNIPVLIEPVLLLIVGLLVALLAMGILVPIYNIGLTL